jgi:transcription antitermination protein NusB
LAKSRRKAREAALRALYQCDVGQCSIRDALFDVLESAELSKDHKEYTETVARGVHEHLEQIDGLLTRYLIDWDLDRIACIDRNLMRLACFELLYIPTMPPAVTLNEAIEIAKKYSTAESGKFVNGVLGSVLMETPKVNWDPSMGEAPEEPAEKEVVIEETVTPEEAEQVKASFWKVRGSSE